GETVGELGMLSSEPRTADVIAVRDTDVVTLSRETYLGLATRYPTLMRHMGNIIARRQRSMLTHTSGQQRARSLSFAFVPITPDADVAELVQRLAGQFDTYADATITDQSAFQSRYGAVQSDLYDPGHATSVIVESLFATLEAASVYTAYITDPTWTAWTHWCVNQADRVVFVANAEADSSQVSAVEVQVREMYPFVRQDLVLLHPPRTIAPQGTRHWLAPRDISKHYHIRRWDDDHLQRAARRMTGHATGLVLSGGGARGMAHVGLIGVLEEQGVPIDEIGGTSMGSIVAGVYARRGTYQDCYTFATDFSSRGGVMDVTLPFSAATAGNGFTRTLRRVAGEGVYIEDLWIPFYAVATDLTHSEPLVFNSGMLWRALRASAAIPAVFPPVTREDGRVLIDGGIMNNFPLDVMHDRLEGGTIIGSLTRTSQSENAVAYRVSETGISGWRLAWAQLNPFVRQKPFPSLPTVLFKTMGVNSLHNLGDYKHLADLLVIPEVDDFGMLDFGNAEAVIERGAETAKPIVSDWLVSAPEYVAPR
ncbi:MAG: patatin-like phospholipase family protein, partial [Chloroflexota bacterium]